MKIDIRSNVGEFAEWFDDVHVRQLPFATALTLTRLAMRGRDHLKEEMPNYVDRPTRFTVNSVFFRRATKSKLRSYIYIDTAKRPYMKVVVTGGQATPQGRAFAEPVAANQKNKHGNLFRGRASRLIGRAHHFTGKPRGRATNNYAGIWKRMGATARNPGGNSIRMLVHWGEPRYQEGSFPFYRITREYVRANLNMTFIEAMNEAVKTARPPPAP